MIEHLPNVHKTLGSIFRTEGKKCISPARPQRHNNKQEADFGGGGGEMEHFKVEGEEKVG